MTRPPTSRIPSPATSKTLADVLAHVQGDTTITPRQRQDMASALRMTARAVGRELSEVPAEPSHLRSRLKDFAPAALGMRAERWANVQSLLRKSLVAAGLGESYVRKRAPFLPQWSEKLDLIDDDHLRLKLTAFARWCGSIGVLPEQVNDASIAAYRTCLDETELTRRPKDIHRELCIAWNRAVEHIEGWPQTRVSVPVHKQSYTLDWESFPASLRANVDAYIDYLAGKDALNSAPKPFRPASLKGMRNSLRQYLSAIVLRGRDAATITSLADAIDIKVFEQALRFFLDRKDGLPPTKKENRALAHRFAVMIVKLARHWLKVDEAHLKELCALRDKVKDHTAKPGMTEKNLTRLSQFDDPKKLYALANLPRNMFKKLLAKGTPTYAEALKAQMAVGIELLLLTVVRRENLGNIEIGRHLIWTAGGDALRLSIPGKEVKNGVPINRPIPAASAKMIALYIKRFRPVLLKEPSDHLFPGNCNGGKQKEYLARQISDTIRKETGLIVNAHLFRHIAAMTYLDAHPGAYGVVRLLAAHKSVETTTTYYCSMEAKSAYRAYDALLDRLRPASLSPDSEATCASAGHSKKSTRKIGRDGKARAVPSNTAPRKPSTRRTARTGKSSGVTTKSTRKKEY